MNFALKNEKFCIKNEKLWIKNEEFCINNDEFCRSHGGGSMGMSLSNIDQVDEQVRNAIID